MREAVFRYEVPKKGEWYEEYCRLNAADIGPLDVDKDLDITLGQRCADVFKPDGDELKERETYGGLQHGSEFFDWIEDEFQDDHDHAITRKNSVIFNTFIFMQLFNEINARKIHNEYNILGNVLDSPIFLAIFIGIAGLQVRVCPTMAD